jgi:hypothetical protein
MRFHTWMLGFIFDKSVPASSCSPSWRRWETNTVHIFGLVANCPTQRGKESAVLLVRFGGMLRLFSSGIIIYNYILNRAARMPDGRTAGRHLEVYTAHSTWEMFPSPLLQGTFCVSYCLVLHRSHPLHHPSMASFRGGWLAIRSVLRTDGGQILGGLEDRRST